jgi:sulfite reductase alpha subunit-like flavoprotein
MTLEYEDYYQYAIKEKRNLVDILFDFKGVKIPLDLLVSYVGWLKPREYSIASSHKKEPSAIRLLVALVEYKTLQGRKLRT